jgi:uncharacterized protein (DUF342 family)
MDRFEDLLNDKAEFDILQTGEIEKGINEGLDVSKYSRPEYSHYLMRQIRKGMEAGIDLTPYVQYDVGVLHEMRRGVLEGLDLVPYVEEGYDSGQLEAIRFALSAHADIAPYLDKCYQGACIRQITLGLITGVDVSVYADPKYTWRKMREIRKGLQSRVNVKLYSNPRYSYWQMHEIRRGLEEGLDVGAYASLMYTAKAMRDKRHAMRASKVSFTTGNVWKSYDDGGCRLHVSNDGMSAYIEVTDPGWRPDAYDIECLSKRYGIVYGINDGGYEEVVRQLRAGKNWVLLASGVRCGSGHDGYYDWNFDPVLNEMPEQTPDGGADFQKIKWFERVSQGQTLATYYPAVAGSDGITVTGQKVAGRKGKELQHLTGRGFRLLPDDRTYVAASDGHVRLKKFRMHVEPLLVVDEPNVDNKVIDFDGSVLVSGNVDGDYEIRATGDVVLDGVLRSSTISSGRNVLVRKGLKGAYGRGSIKALGSVIGRYFEDASVTAGGNIYLSASLNSTLTARGGIVTYGRNGGIVGGSAYAEKGLCLSNAGNEVGRETVLDAGVNARMVQDYRIAEEQKEILEEELGRLRETYNTICRKYNEVERNGIAMFLGMEKSINDKEQEKRQCESKLAALSARIGKALKSRIIIEGQMYSNVTVVFNQREYHPRQMRNGVLSQKGEELYIGAI